MLTAALTSLSGGRRPSFLAVSLSVFLLLVTLSLLDTDQRYGRSAGVTFQLVEVGTPGPQGNDRETREFFNYFTPHVFEHQELGLLFISQRRRHQRTTQSIRPTRLQGLGTLGMHAKRKEKGGSTSSPVQGRSCLGINDDWKRGITSSRPDHCLELSSSDISCEALLDT